MIFEPTNIIPSALTGTGTIASADLAKIQWQVNGNSAMTKFQIDVYQQDYASTFLFSTGIRTDGCPFYGKDRRGNTVMFSYDPTNAEGSTMAVVWSNWGLSDGNEYKYKITQWYKTQNAVVSKTLAQSVTANTNYYFAYANSNGTPQGYIGFSVGADTSLFVQNGTVLYYSLTEQKGWLVRGNRMVPYTMSLNEEAPEENYTQLSGDAAVINTLFGEAFTQQNSFAAIQTRENPTVTVAPFTAPISTSSQSFTATYTQAQGDSIRSVRWQLALIEIGDPSQPATTVNEDEDIIDDTGVIYTPVLEYSYAGFINGNTYAVRCIIETENGIQAISEWVQFEVQYTENVYTGTFNVECICRDDNILLTWDNIAVFPGEATPENGYSIAGSKLTLDDFSQVSWEYRYSENNNQQYFTFEAPWTVVWNGEFFKTVTEVSAVPNAIQQSPVFDIALNSTGSLAVMVGGNTDIDGVAYASLYTIVDDSVTQISQNFLTADDQKGAISSVVVNDRVIFLGGEAAGVSLYFLPQREEDEPSFEGKIQYPTGTNIPCSALALNANGTLLAVGASTENADGYGYANLYAVTGVTGVVPNVSYQSTIGGNIDGAVRKMVFSPNGQLLVVAGGFTGQAKLYSVSNVTATFVGNIQINGGALNRGIQSAVFSPDGSLLVLAGYRSDVGETAGCVSVFAVNGTQLTYLKDLSFNGQNVFSSAATGAAFNADGSLLVVTGILDNALAVFSVNGQTIAQLQQETIAAPSVIDPEAKIGVATCLALTPDGRTILVGGQFTERAIRFRVRSGETILSLDYLDSTTSTLTNGWLTISKHGTALIVQANGTTIGTLTVNDAVPQAVIALTPQNLYVYQFSGGIQVSDTITLNLTYTQQNVSRVTLHGYQVCNYLAVFDGDGLDVIPLLSDAGFVPTRQNADYTIDLLADFNSGLDGGTGTSVGEGFRIYRRQNDDEELKEIAYVPANITQIKDYGIKSRTRYTYYFYAYDATGAFMGVIESREVCVSFDQCTLLATEYDETDGCYHVVKAFRFLANLDTMTVSNNNSPQLSQNFTRYPTKHKSTANYASGTLQGLIGVVNAAIGEYYDDADWITELTELSTSDYTLFLKDMKGFIRLVTVSNPIQYSPQQSTIQMQTTISLPWAEIGEVGSDVSVIQTPSDAGWNYDDQVFDVELDVDVYTGVLSATYPPAYYGTTFSMARERDLLATTPADVTPADFYLSPVAEEGDDGILTATSQRPD